MLRYVRVMTNRERATEADYEAAKRDKPRFYKPKDGEPLMRVEHTPEEVDELLFQTDTLEIPDRKSTRLNSSHVRTSYAVFCLKKKKRGASPQSPDHPRAGR